MGGRARARGLTHDSMHTGTVQVNVNQTAISAVTVACYEVLLQADLSNDANVLVGNDRQGCVIELTAGSSISIPINDVAKIIVRAVAGTQRVSWLAMT